MLIHKFLANGYVGRAFESVLACILEVIEKFSESLDKKKSKIMAKTKNSNN
jgi:hypothetical protein